MAFGIPASLLYIAEKKTEQTIRDYEVFLQYQQLLRKLEQEVDYESWRWPIFARPVLYTPIDRTAQIFFSNIQRALENAKGLEKVIQPPPPRPLQRRELISPRNNSKRIQACLDIQANIKNFEEALIESNNQLKTLRQSHKQEELIEEKIRQALVLLEKRVDDNGKKVKTMARGNLFDEAINWAQTNTQNCLLESRNQLAQSRRDGINFAVADVFIHLSNNILDHFDLYEQELSIPARFELDHFEHHHGMFKKCISTMLGAQINDWYSVRSTSRVLELVDRNRQQSVRSLRIFLASQQQLYNLEQKLQSLDLPKIEQEAQQVEKDCDYYWRPIDQDPFIWNKVLKSDPQPRISLDDAKRSYQVDIFPKIGADAVIKQSDMSKIILHIKAFLNTIDIARANAVKLNEELQIHKQAQIEVNIKLGPTGSTYQQVRKLATVESDTSPDVQEDCIVCRKDFDIFQARAKTVQGANFPSMLDEIDVFEAQCKGVRQKHDTLMESKRQEYFNLTQQLITINGDIKRLKEAKPRIEYDVTGTVQKINVAIKNFSNESMGYRDINTAISETKSIVAISNKDRNQLEKLWQGYLVVYNETTKKIEAMAELINDHVMNSNECWRWAQSAYEKALKPIRRNYSRHIQELNQLATLDIAVKQATAICQGVKADIINEFDDAVEKLEDIRTRQDEFNNIRQALESSTQKTTMFSFTPRDSDLIRELCVQATVAPNAEGVIIALDLAKSLLEKRLSRDEAVRIINNNGLYVEQQTVESGASAMNAGRDINYYRTQPNIG